MLSRTARTHRGISREIIEHLAERKYITFGAILKFHATVRPHQFRREVTVQHIKVTDHKQNISQPPIPGGPHAHSHQISLLPRPCDTEVAENELQLIVQLLEEGEQAD